jgi:cephalosporin hydroxylase
MNDNRARPRSVVVRPSSLVVDSDGERREISIYSEEAFAILCNLWLRSGWQQRVSYRFTWMGVPVIQLPEDLLTMQAVIHRVRPDVIVETGTAHGGSAIFYASILELLGGGGRVVSVDVEIRPHNRRAIDAHALGRRVRLIEGSSIAPETVARVREAIRPGERVLVALDSNHTRAHVEQELEHYAPLVTAGSYLVVFDGVMKDLADAPSGRPEWATDNPLTAVEAFLAEHPEFERDAEIIPYPVTHCPGGFLRRRPSEPAEPPRR